MFTTEQLQEKWKPVLDHSSMEPITDHYRRAVTAQLLENQEQATLQEQASSGGLTMLTEAGVSTVSTGSTADNAAVGFGGGAAATVVAGRAGYDPIMISLIRRAAPQLIAFDVCGVQPMTGPTGIIFYMRSNYVNPRNNTDSIEAFFGEADAGHSARAEGGDGSGTVPSVPAGDPFDTTSTPDYVTAQASDTKSIEEAGSSTDNHFNEMTFNIDKTSVTARSRALKAEFTTELAQDLKAIHGLDAETELANILSTEILSEINREVIRTILINAVLGAQDNVTTGGTFDLATDSNGRWSVEKFKGLHFQLEREANAIAVKTRRGRGNWIIASADVVAALSMTGNLDTGIDKGAVATGQVASDGITGNTFVGTLNGRYKVYVDPYYVASTNGDQYICVGYKGSSPYDAGLFYCPYVPLSMVRATGEDTFQPKIGFKTRYGIVGNPFATDTPGTDINYDQGNPAGTNSANNYFRKLRVTNLM